MSGLSTDLFTGGLRKNLIEDLTKIKSSSPELIPASLRTINRINLASNTYSLVNNGQDVSVDESTDFSGMNFNRFNFSENNTYIVKQGDTLSDISIYFDIPLDNLVTVNNIQDPNKINVGQNITIPSQ